MKKRLLIMLVIVALVVAVLPMSAFAVTTPSEIVVGTVGDIDNNGTPDDWDAITLERYLADWDGLTVDDVIADIDQNGVVNDWDAVCFARTLADWEGYTLAEILDRIYPEQNIRTYEPVQVPAGDTSLTTDPITVTIVGTSNGTFREGIRIDGENETFHINYKLISSNNNADIVADTDWLVALLNNNTSEHYLITNYKMSSNAYVELGEAGKLVDFTEWEYMLGDYLTGPDTWGLSPDGWQIAKEALMTEDGSLYVLPRYAQDQMFYGMIADYNYLQTLGVEELPADWDDFYALMLRAKEQDPESIPFTTFEGHYTYSISPVAGSYGIATDAGYQWLAQNGQANWAFSTDEYLYTLQTLNSMVDDGLIQESPDYPNSIIHSYDSEDGDDPGWTARELWKEPVTNGKTFLAWERYTAIVGTLREIAADSSDWKISMVQPVHDGYSTAYQYFAPYSNTGVAISSNDDNVIKRLCAYINYWCTEDGINAYSDSVLYRQGSQMGTNGAQLGILLDEDEGSNRVVQFNRYATVSTAVRQNNGDYYRMTWDTTDTDMEAKVTALADIARQFTNNFLQRKFTDEKTAWNDYLKALNAAGYNEVYAYKQAQLDNGTATLALASSTY